MKKREKYGRGKDTEDGRIPKREEYSRSKKEEREEYGRGKDTEEGRIPKREEYVRRKKEEEVRIRKRERLWRAKDTEEVGEESQKALLFLPGIKRYLFSDCSRIFVKSRFSERWVFSRFPSIFTTKMAMQTIFYSGNPQNLGSFCYHKSAKFKSTIFMAIPQITNPQISLGSNPIR
jgi:hypothetical protein